MPYAQKFPTQSLAFNSKVEKNNCPRLQCYAERYHHISLFVFGYVVCCQSQKRLVCLRGQRSDSENCRFGVWQNQLFVCLINGYTTQLLLGTTQSPLHQGKQSIPIDMAIGIDWILVCHSFPSSSQIPLPYKSQLPFSFVTLYIKKNI